MAAPIVAGVYALAGSAASIDNNYPYAAGDGQLCFGRALEPCAYQLRAGRSGGNP